MPAANVDPAGESPGPNNRDVSRTAMFVAATLVIGGQPNPVRIRNMSVQGALIEGAVLPKPGDQADLVRASLRVSGKAAWTRGNQCGFSFAENVDIGEWMARTTPTHQQWVDAAVHQIRQGVDETPSPQTTRAGQAMASDEVRLKAAIALLEQMEETFSDVDELIQRYPEQVQSIDRVLQILRAMLFRPRG